MDDMNKISSFTIDHLRLLPGIYVSRKDYLKGDTLTTFDLRFTKPYTDSVMETDGVHALEHLGATFLRNHKNWKDKIIYFGPMGCRTGFYLIISEDLKSTDIIPIMKEMMEYIIEFTGDIPGAIKKECGNYLDSNLQKAKHYAQKFRQEVLINPTEKNLTYPRTKG